MVISARNTEHIIMHLQIMGGNAPSALDRQVDQRQAQRPQLGQSVIVSVLGTGQLLHGEIRTISEDGTQILLDQPLRYGSRVTIDYDDNHLLGEVVYSYNEQAGSLVGVRVEHAWLGRATLAFIGERIKDLFADSGGVEC